MKKLSNDQIEAINTVAFAFAKGDIVAVPAINKATNKQEIAICFVTDDEETNETNVIPFGIIFGEDNKDLIDLFQLCNTNEIENFLYRCPKVSIVNEFKFSDVPKGKSISGHVISESARSFLYLCNFDNENLKIRPYREMEFETQFEGYNAYANIPNPVSQLVTGETYEELIEELDKLHKKMEDPIWLKSLYDSL